MLIWVLFVYLISAKDVDLRLLLKLQNVGELTEKFWQFSETNSQLTQNDLNRYSCGMIALPLFLSPHFEIQKPLLLFLRGSGARSMCAQCE